MSLRSIVKSSTGIKGYQNVVNLYRSVIRELPRVMAIYDVDMPMKQASKAIKFHFIKHSKLEDERVIGLLISKGYMELEETLKQWKQKTHLLRILEPIELSAAFVAEDRKFIDPDIVPKALGDALNSSDAIAFSKFFASVSEDEAEKWMNVLCATKGTITPAATVAPEDDDEAYSALKSAFAWDPADKKILRGSMPSPLREEPISINAKYYYN